MDLNENAVIGLVWGLPVAGAGGGGRQEAGCPKERENILSLIELHSKFS